MMQAQLTVVSGPDKDRTIALDEGQTVVLGRGEAATARLIDPHVSRTHCQVQVAGGKFLLKDLGSRGGTLVNGRPLAEHALQPGDVVRIGGTELRFQLAGAPAAPTGLSKPKPAPKVAPLEQLVGTKLAFFEIEKQIAAGHSGLVFRARDTEHDRTVALKVLWPDTSKNEEAMQRFIRAMKTMLGVRHPNLVELYAAGKNGPYCWAAMEFIEGESATDLIDRIGIQGMLDWREAYRAAVHIGRALEEAHQRKIIHRNVTPANILRRHTDRAFLLGDLMLAKALEGAQARQVTQPGQLVGDVPYMSPERTGEGEVDHRSDIYMLGATTYALLTGRAPFAGNSLPELVRQVRQAEPVKPKEFQRSVNDQFQEVVLKMLAKRPDDRYLTPGALLRDLDRVGRFAKVEADYEEWGG
jgi:serine/threonine protein kinase